MTALANASRTEGLLSSGTSPGAPSVHLLGPGRVGRAFLRASAGRVRLVAVSDRSGTAYAREGFDPLALAAHKERGGTVLELPGARDLPLDLALDLVRADVVVDATPGADGDAAPGADGDATSRADGNATPGADGDATPGAGGDETPGADGDGGLGRCRAALRAGSRIALAAKGALARAPRELLESGRVGCNAALGGAGARLLRELHDLRAHARAVALVANASTTGLVLALEAGLDLEAALARCRSRGTLEPDPARDLDGTDAALKLLCVAGAVLGVEASLAEVRREDARALEPERAAARRLRGATTRLVARADRRGLLRVALEELPRSSPLAVPSDRVAYAYELDDGRTRVHVGTGIGPRNTARALLADVLSLAARGGAA